MNRADAKPAPPLLEIRDLHTYFFLEGGPAKAVEGVSLRIESGKTLTFTGLQIHLVEAHGFYEGRGSRYRLDPARLKEVLEL